jgi:hypothetical protein
MLLVEERGAKPTDQSADKAAHSKEGPAARFKPLLNSEAYTKTKDKH